MYSRVRDGLILSLLGDELWRLVWKRSEKTAELCVGNCQLLLVDVKDGKMARLGKENAIEEKEHLAG